MNAPAWLLAGALAGLALYALRRAARPAPALETHPRDAWVQTVVRACWTPGEYVDATLHVFRTRTGFRVCRGGDSEYELVSRARLRSLLRQHWDACQAEARRDLAGGGVQ